MFSKEERSTFPYWFAHWCAFQMTALNCRAWKFKYLFHDIEKPWLRLFLPYSKVQELHRKYNRHHPEWLNNKLNKADDKAFPNRISDEQIKKYLNKFDYEAAIIDWECCHFTKAEEPFDAHNEYKRLIPLIKYNEKYSSIAFFCYDEFSQRLLDTIKKLGLENE